MATLRSIRRIVAEPTAPIRSLSGFRAPSGTRDRAELGGEAPRPRVSAGVDGAGVDARTVILAREPIGRLGPLSRTRSGATMKLVILVAIERSS